ncbi:unnamed protein product, partial [Didymodactylos carnosus]
MTSFASAFSTDQKITNGNSIESSDNMDNNNFLNATVPNTSTTSLGTFSSIDLDQPKHSYISLSDASVFNNSRQQPPQSQHSPLSTRHTNDLATSASFSTSTSTIVDRRISTPDATKLLSRIDSVKRWGLSTYKCTKQSMLEKFGKSTRTVDSELETQIEQLKETKRRYENMLILARAWQNHFAQLMHTQRALGDTFSELQQRSIDLCDEFSYNAETQRLIAKNGDSLLSAISYFISTLNTLCTKTMEDTMNTIRLYESTRIEYDAYRNDYDLLQKDHRTDSTVNDLSEIQRDYQLQKERYEKLKSDVGVKLKFLEENR